MRCHFLLWWLLAVKLSQRLAAGEENSLLIVPQSDDTDDEDAEIGSDDGADVPLTDRVFLPTKEWQTVHPGQSVPAGLHIRMDIQTGAKEAKLMDGDDGERFKRWTDGDRQGMVNTADKHFTVEELKQALKSMKADDKGPEELADVQKEALPKESHRSYSELQSDFEKMNLAVKSDVQVIREHLDLLRLETTALSLKLAVMEDLEYYVHQIDNGQHFVGMGGLEVVSKCLNSTDVNSRKMAAFLMGSASLSNPQVQAAAVDGGVLHQLTRALATDTDLTAKKKYLYALSAILRNFPSAQSKFMQLGGSEVLATLFDGGGGGGDERLRVRAVTLLYDLMGERRFLEASGELSEDERARLDLYAESRLAETLVEQGWCARLVALMVGAPADADLDSQEKVLAAMHLLAADCAADFDAARRPLGQLVELWRDQLRDDGDDDDYLHSLIDTVESILVAAPLHDARNEL